MTALEVITRALRKLKVYAAGEGITAEDAEDCLDALNDMLAGWAIDGIDLAHIALGMSDELDVPDNHLRAIQLSLAEQVAADFGAQWDQADAMLAERGRMALRAYHFSIAEIRIDHPAAQPAVAYPDFIR